MYIVLTILVTLLILVAFMPIGNFIINLFGGLEE